MIEKKTITWVVKNGLCTGCATCISLCPHSAISLTISKSKGIFLPGIDQNSCNQCSICLMVCPGYSVDFKNLNLTIFDHESRDILLGDYIDCYLGYSTNKELRFKASSGGLVPTLLIYALEMGIIDGALVTRMSKQNPLVPQPFIARTREEILSSIVSKYCPVPANIALKEILEHESRYAIVGLPCHLHGIRKAEIVNKYLRERIVLHIGIFCGINHTFKATEFQLQRMGIRKEDVTQIRYRGEGWPGDLAVQLKTGQHKIVPISEYKDDNFCSFIPWRCTVCIDHTSELADISFGDAWVPEILSNDKLGTSIIISRSKKSEEVLYEMKQKAKIVLTPVDVARIVESQGGLVNKKRDSRARLNISKLYGKKAPIYNSQLLHPNLFQSYIVNGLLYYFRTFLASKRYLWWVLKTLNLLLHYIIQLKSKFE